MQAMTLRSVVLPEPEGPRSATTSPGATSIETSRKRIDARFALAEMLGDSAQTDEWRRAAVAVGMLSPPARLRGRP